MKVDAGLEYAYDQSNYWHHKLNSQQNEPFEIWILSYFNWVWWEKQIKLMER